MRNVKTKKTIRTILLALMLTTLTLAFKTPALAKEELTIEGDSEVTSGDRIELTPYLDGEELDAEDVKWYSDDTHVAEVDKKGRVTGGSIRKKMTVVITAKYDHKETSFDVTVFPRVRKINIYRNDKLVTGTRMDFEDSASGKTMVLEATCLPEDALQEIEWATEDDDIAEVNEDGTVTLVGTGLAKIYAKAMDGSDAEGFVEISVEAPIEDIDIKMEGSSDTSLVVEGQKEKRPVITAGDEIALYADLKPKEAKTAALTWYSNNRSAITVDEDGIATAKSVKEVTRCALAAKSNANPKIYDDFPVVVIPRFDVMYGDKRINGGSMQMAFIDGYKDVALKVDHGYGANAKLKWSTDNEDILYIDSDGTLLAKGPGKTTAKLEIHYDDDSYVSTEFRVIIRGDGDGHYSRTDAMNEVDEYVLSKNDNDTKSMTITCIGDSITFGTVLLNDVDYKKVVYPTYLQKYLDAGKVNSLGVGGMPMAREPKGLDKNSWEYYDWNPCVYDILFNDNKNKLEPGNDNPNEEYYLDANILRLKKSDVIIVSAGVNDSLQPFSSMEEGLKRFGKLNECEEKTFYGDVDRIMKRLKEIAPDAQIIFFTPYHNLRSDQPGMLPLEMYVEAIKQVGAQNGVTVVDTYHQDFMNTEDGFITKKFMPDGIHGNARGNKLIAKHVGAWIVRVLNGV